MRTLHLDHPNGHVSAIATATTDDVHNPRDWDVVIQGTFDGHIFWGHFPQVRATASQLRDSVCQLRHAPLRGREDLQAAA